MNIIPCADPNAHSEYPAMESPVHVTLDVPVFYKKSEDDIVAVHSPIVCSLHLAETVLAILERELKAEGKALVHLGVYNQRMARHKDGSLIFPHRISNHALGLGIDWAGYAEIDGSDWWSVGDEEANAILITNIRDKCIAAIGDAGRHAEIVNEGGWLHLGMFPWVTK